MHIPSLFLLAKEIFSLDLGAYARSVLLLRNICAAIFHVFLHFRALQFHPYLVQQHIHFLSSRLPPDEENISQDLR